MNFSNTKRANALCRFQFSKIFYLLPFFTLSFLVALLGVFIIESAGRTTFATPGAPGSPGHPATLTTSVSSPTVNFHFSAAELQSSTFKTSSVTVNISTNNETGAITYMSSVDEDTNLNATDPSITQHIPTIDDSKFSDDFTENQWGFRVSDNRPPFGIFDPIAKASDPNVIYVNTIPETVTRTLEFGIKPSPNLPAGTYTKQILITSVTNHVPTSTVFIPGQNFKNAITSLGPTGVVKSFKHANAAPPAGAATTVVSTADSEVPAYAWYDPAAQSILWWSDADTAYANEDSSYMFHDIGDNYSDMDLIDMTGINTSRVKNMAWMFHGGKYIVKHINLTGFNTSNVEDMSYMFGSFTMGANFDLDPIDFSSFDTSKVTNMEYMFAGSYLPSINIRNFNTSRVTNMRHMFSDLGKITSLDLSGLDVRNVSHIDLIFYNSQTLNSLNLDGWHLDSIYDMSGMFESLRGLTELHLHDFATRYVTNMKCMFCRTTKLTRLDLSSFDTSQVTDMSSMFEDMESLYTINLSSFDTSNVTTMNRMFFMNVGNPPITDLDLSSFNTSRVTDMERMFVGLAYLQNLNVSSFNTRNVENMEAMFYYTFVVNQNDTQLDISNFDTHNLRRADGMFNYMKVKTIYASPNFVTDNLTPNPANIFMDNSNLTGGNGTTWAWPNYTSNFAHIDAPGNPGYFTQKP